MTHNEVSMDDLKDQPLKPGEIITIFSRALQQCFVGRFVRMAGANSRVACIELPDLRRMYGFPVRAHRD